MEDIELIVTSVMDAAFRIHRRFGPGLFECVYEALLARELEREGFRVERQKRVKVVIDGLAFDHAFRVDLLVNRVLLVEIKSVERLAPEHWKQALTYLRLMDLRVGLLINFGSAVLKDGFKRVVNRYDGYPASRRRPVASSREASAEDARGAEDGEATPPAASTV